MGSKIEWTDETWNPVTGCDRVSPGCAHCYALELAPRLRRFAEARGSGKWLEARDGGPRSGPAFGVTLHPGELDKPLRWRRPRRIFVNSMSDLFHEEIPDDFIARVFAVMAAARQHAFQVLTKRPERMRELLTDDGWVDDLRFHVANGYCEEGWEDAPVRMDAWPLPNVLLGVSIENRRFVGRADVLRETPAAVRFISAEPLLGPLVYDWITLEDKPWGGVGPGWRDCHAGPELNLRGIDWLIVGGESGPRHRPMRVEWVRALRDACAQTRCSSCYGTGVERYDDGPPERCPLCKGRPVGTAFFFKQWGGPKPTSGGRLLDGRTWDEQPGALRWRTTRA